ncbi:hypothetical protein FOZ63_005746 [Perkinsus olseni]|uniref:ATP-binding cassette sub- F member 1 n=1 Tax=Perkinsus olseni TaxID=32597 RepID=A0A7J6Q3R5_PEROL|nr:hypothetical protein FOZ63_005746 [Perkinsus olseni]
MSCIDSLAKAINNYNGGLVLVSHDFRLISQVAKEIWVVDHGVKRWDGSIEDYKKSLTKQVLRSGHRKRAPQVAKTVVAKNSSALPSRRRRSSSSRMGSTSSTTADTRDWTLARESTEMARLRRKYQSLEKAYKALEDENDTVKEQL